MKLRLALARGREQLDRNPPDHQRGLRVSLYQAQGLFIERAAPLVLAHVAAWALQVPRQRRGVLANHEKSPPAGQAKHNSRGAKVAVGHDTVPRRDGGQHFLEQGALLGVGVFAGHHLSGQIQLGIVEHQRLPRQGGRAVAAQCPQAMLRARQVVAVQHPHPIAAQQGPWLGGHLLQAGL